MAEVVLKINGKAVENTFKSLSAHTRKLERELRKLPIGTDDFLKKAEEVKEARAHFEKVKNEINAVRFATEESANWFNRLGNSIGVTVLNFAKGQVIAGFFDNLLAKVSGSGEKLLELADAMSGVKKTTGLATEEVKALWDEFDNIDTRTTKMELMKIAEMAGRLGIQSKDEVAEFTKEIDKAYVALGDSFSGGLEAVSTKLGKIKGLFEDTSELSYATAINKVGSALNELAANGTSSEENISDFALRVGQLPSALKPSIDATLGLGAAFEESGIDAQIAASGYSKFITTAAENIDAFAYSMHMTVDEAKKLINTKPEEFLLRFSQGMKNLNSIETSNVLDSLKLNTLEVVKVVGAAAQKTQRFTDAMNLSNEAMNEMISLDNEFNEVNNNSAAIWEKLKNTVDNFFTSGEFINHFSGLIKLLGDFAGVTDDASGAGSRLRTLLKDLWSWTKILITTWGAYLAITKLQTVWTTKSAAAIIGETAAKKISAYWSKIMTAADLLLTAAKAKLTGNTLQANLAMATFNKTIKLNPLGLLVTVLVMAVMYIKEFGDEVDTATNKQSQLNSVMSEAQKKISDEKYELEQLLYIARDENRAKEDRLKAIKKINEISPEYLGNLTLEKINTNEATTAINNYIKALERKATAEAFQEKRTQIKKELLDISGKPNSDYAKTGDGFTKFMDNFNRTSYGRLKKTEYDFEELIKYTDKQIKELQIKEKYTENAWNLFLRQRAEYRKKLEEENFLNSKQEEWLKDSDNLNTYLDSGSGNGGNSVVPDSGKNNQDKKNRVPQKRLNLNESSRVYKEWKKAVEEGEKDINEAKVKLMQEGFEKELAQIELERNQRLSEIQKEKDEVDAARIEIAGKIAELNTELNKTKDKDKKAAIENSISEYEGALTKMDNLIETHREREANINQTYNSQIRKAESEALTKLINEKQKAFQEMQKIDLVNKNLEIEQLNVTEKEKEKLRKKFELKQLEEQTQHINELKQLLVSTLNNGEFEGLNLQEMILTEEGKAQIEQNLKDLGLNLNEIALIMARIKNGGKEDEEFDGVGIIGGDVLGMSPESWEKMFENLDKWQGKVEMIVGVTRAMQQAWATFHDLQMKKEEESLRRFEANANRKKDALKKQLDEGYINQREYDAKIKQLEEAVNKRKAELEYKKAKFDKRNSIINSIINTAVAVTSALKAGPILGPILAGVVGAMGAVQTAMIAGQPLPSKNGYAKGGFTQGLGWTDESGHEVAGVVHKNEWVAPEWMLKAPETAKVIDWLEAKRTGKNTPFADGGFTEQQVSTIESQ